jgi:hypothetical protein
MMQAAKESVFEVYSARCPMCGTWGVWDLASLRSVNGPRVPFESCCLVCGNLFRVNAFDSGFVTFEARAKGFSKVRPVADFGHEEYQWNRDSKRRFLTST